jgi:hypothetical protein
VLAGELVDVGAVQAQLAPPDAQAVDHAGPRPRGDLGLDPVLAALVEDLDDGAVVMPRAAASSAWISSTGSASMSRRLLTLTKLELRKLRAGGEIMASGNSSDVPAASWLGTWPGRPSAPSAASRALKNSQRPEAVGNLAFGKGRIGQVQRGKAFVQQLLEVDLVAEHRAAQLLVAVGKQGSARPMWAASSRNIWVLGLAWPMRRDGRAVQQRVGVAVGAVHVPVLQLRGGRQDVVGVVGGVGLEVLEHHGEQVFARKALHHLAGLGRHRHRVAVVDDERLDPGAELRRGGRQQRVAYGAHVDGARLPAVQQVGPLQRRPVHREQARAAQQHAAGAMPPGARQRGQAGDGAGRVAAAVHALHAVVQAYGGRLVVHHAFAVIARQRTDLFGRHAADGGGAFGAPLQRAFAQAAVGRPASPGCGARCSRGPASRG